MAEAFNCTHRAAHPRTAPQFTPCYPSTHGDTHPRTVTFTHAQSQEPCSVRDGRGFINAVAPVYEPRYPITPRRNLHGAHCRSGIPSVLNTRFPSLIRRICTHRATHPHTATPTHAQWQEPPFGARRQKLYQRSDTCSQTAPPIHALRRNLHRATHPRTVTPIHAR